MTSKTRVELSSNSKLAGEAASSRSAQFSWKWQGNSSIPLPLSHFFPSFCLFPPFFFGFAFPFLLPLKRERCDECDRISTRAVPLPSPVVSSVRSASFHLLDYHVLFCPRKKHSPRTIFRWKTERSTCFYRRNSRVRSDAHKYSHNSLNRCFALYQCFDRSRI